MDVSRHGSAAGRARLYCTQRMDDRLIDESSQLARLLANPLITPASECNEDVHSRALAKLLKDSSKLPKQ